jgi:hypothetical protein
LYRQREGSLVHSIIKEGEYNSVRKYFLEWLEKYIKQNNFDDKELQRLMIRALLPYRDADKNTFKKLALRVLRKLKKTPVTLIL